MRELQKSLQRDQHLNFKTASSICTSPIYKEKAFEGFVEVALLMRWNRGVL